MAKVNWSEINVDELHEALRFYGGNSLAIYLNRNPSDVRNMSELVVKALPNKGSLEKIESPMLEKLRTYVAVQANGIYKKNTRYLDFSLAEEAFGTEARVPLEAKLQLSKGLRAKSYFGSLEKYDVLIGNVLCHNTPYYILTVLCFANGKRRQIDDLDHRVHLSVDKVDGNVKTGDFVRVVVTGSNMFLRHTYVTAKVDDLPKERRRKNLMLGVITVDMLPTYYKKLIKGEHEESYLSSEVPQCDVISEEKLAAFGIHNDRTLSNKKLCVEDRAKYIRNKQICDLSNKRNEQGLMKAIDEKTREAINLFKKALQYKPDNVDALVNLGSAYRLLKCHDKAVKIFERALTHRPNHEMAKSLLSATLLHLALHHDPSMEKQQIFKTYEKAFKHNSLNNEFLCNFSKLVFDMVQESALGGFALQESFMAVAQVDSDMDIEEADSNIIEVSGLEQLKKTPGAMVDRNPPPKNCDGGLVTSLRVSTASQNKAPEKPQKILRPSHKEFNLQSKKKNSKVKPPKNSSSEELNNSDSGREFEEGECTAAAIPVDLPKIESLHLEPLASEDIPLPTAVPPKSTTKPDPRPQRGRSYSRRHESSSPSSSSSRLDRSRYRPRPSRSSSSSGSRGRRTSRHRYSRSPSHRHRPRQYRSRRSRTPSRDSYRRQDREKRRIRRKSMERYQPSHSRKRSCSRDRKYGPQHKRSTKSPSSVSNDSFALRGDGDYDEPVGSFRYSTYVSASKAPALEIMNNMIMCEDPASKEESKK